jgi:DNA-binding LytR/AlgR family response regulator
MTNQHLRYPLAVLPQPPRLVFTTGNANRATDAFRLEAVDYLLKPLDPEQVTEAVNRLLAYLRPFKVGSFPSSCGQADGIPTTMITPPLSSLFIRRKTFQVPTSRAGC